LVDVLGNISEEDFNSLELEKATMRLVEEEEQANLLKKIDPSSVKKVSGGSVANSTIAFAQLGAPSSFAGVVSRDLYGTFYKAECEDLGVAFPVPPADSGATGVCVSLITPDAERTMRTHLGVATTLSDRHINDDIIKNSEWIFIEGYLLSNPTGGQQAVKKAVEIASRVGTKIAVTCSEAWVIQSFGDALNGVLEKASLVFANEEESMALAGESNVEKAFEKLSSKYGSIFVTHGPEGAFYSHNGKKGKVSAYKTDPIDLTGAGDMFAGGVLYGIAQNLDPEVFTKKSCYLASKVIAQVGARLDVSLRELWKEAS